MTKSISAKITCECPRCGAAYDIAFILLGSRGTCSSCRYPLVHHRKSGAQTPHAKDDAISCSDFRQLLSPPAPADIERYLGAWFSLTIIEDPVCDVRVVNKAGEAVDIDWLHQRIQEDAEKRGKLYQAAMSVWR